MLFRSRVIADAMNARMHNKVDILLDQNAKAMIGNKAIDAAHALGVCKNVSIRVMGRVDISKMPKSQEELARLVEGGATLAIAK